MSDPLKLSEYAATMQHTWTWEMHREVEREVASLRTALAQAVEALEEAKKHILYIIDADTPTASDEHTLRHIRAVLAACRGVMGRPE